MSVEAIRTPELAARYEVRATLGSGGMGEVLLCRDERIGRDVAVKVMRPELAADGERRRRFLREARVQAQLEHPSIVPVYDIVEGEGDTAWLVMKRVRGTTLDEVLAALRRGNEGARAPFPASRLLPAFLRVCQAVAYAHSRSVVHRDLKPSNVMLGEFGEVWVLDWGLAKWIGEDEPQVGSSEIVRDGLLSAEGASLGTPGYMAPEQAAGEPDVGPAADVYALGAILFEIVTGGPLHPATSTQQRIEQTLRGAASAIASAEAAEIAPELLAACRRACAFDPADRDLDARELGAIVQRYVEGDRDLARRHALAERHVAEASALLALGDEHSPHATRELALALALDPDHDEASATLARLLLTPPRHLPVGARAQLWRWVESSWQSSARFGVWRYLLWLSYIPVYLALGVRDFATFVIAIGLLASATLLMRGMGRGVLRGQTPALGAFVTSTLALLVFAQAYSPLVLMPPLAATNVMFFAAHSSRSQRRFLIALGMIAATTPFLLEAAGLVPPTFEITEHGIVIVPRMLSFPPEGTWAFLFSSTVLMVLIPSLLAGRARDALANAERKLVLQAWQLRELVPAAVRPPATP